MNSLAEKINSEYDYESERARDLFYLIKIILSWVE